MEGERAHPGEMKLLIAIETCWRDERNGCNDAVRETWLPQCKSDVRFFFGEPDIKLPISDATDDAIWLGISDSYDALPMKTQEICRYAYGQGYDFVLKCDRDTYLFYERFMKSGFQKFDYTGHFRNDLVYAVGGSGYCLSRRAMLCMANAKITDHAEDRWVGSVLATGMNKYHDERYIGWNYGEQSPRVLTVHLSQGTDIYKPEWMRELHAKQVTR